MMYQDHNSHADTNTQGSSAVNQQQAEAQQDKAEGESKPADTKTDTDTATVAATNSTIKRKDGDLLIRDIAPVVDAISGLPLNRPIIREYNQKPYWDFDFDFYADGKWHYFFSMDFVNHCRPLETQKANAKQMGFPCRLVEAKSNTIIDEWG